MDEKASERLATVAKRMDLPEATRLELAEIAGALSSPLQSDKWIYRIVVGVLGLIALVTVMGGIVLAVMGRGGSAMAMPEGVIAIGSAAVGALAGLLAPSPRANGS